MRQVNTTGLGCSLAMLLLTCGSLAAEEAAIESPKLEQVGEDRYRVGNIIVDKKTRSFEVPGKVLHLTDALEYFAVASDGMKGYESLLELTTTPREFNLACILIGLDDKKSVKPRYQFDEQKPDGQSVDISLSWEEDGKSVTVSAANAMTAGEDVFDDDSWVYIGSALGDNGKQFMAEVGGTLIGFVHDPYSIIDHRNGGGIGAYGLITGNEKALPEEGSAVTLSVKVIER